MLKSVSAWDRSIVSPSRAPTAAPVTRSNVIAVRTIRLAARLPGLNTTSPFPHLRRDPPNRNQRSGGSPITSSSTLARLLPGNKESLKSPRSSVDIPTATPQFPALHRSRSGWPGPELPCLPFSTPTVSRATVEPPGNPQVISPTREPGPEVGALRTLVRLGAGSSARTRDPVRLGNRGSPPRGTPLACPLASYRRPNRGALKRDSFGESPAGTGDL